MANMVARDLALFNQGACGTNAMRCGASTTIYGPETIRKQEWNEGMSGTEIKGTWTPGPDETK